MRSQVNGHFPQIRFFGGRKWLFNPVLKKRFANRPEEQVRLQYVEFLIHQTTVSNSRIGFETPVKTESAENTLRADLVIYDRNMAPSVLIECKSGRIKLNAKTAQQTARYNRTLQADYLMITNGIDDFWYRRDGQTVSPLKKHPFELIDLKSDSTHSTQYWMNRGFLHSNLPAEIAEGAGNFLRSVFTSSSGSENFTYLNLPQSISPVSLDHFYRIEQTDSGDSLALSFIADASTQTLVAAVLNRDGQNQGILWLPLTDLFESDRPEAVRLTPGGSTTVRFPEDVRLLMTSPSKSNVKKLVNYLIKLFD